jgi:hypothetical protein
MEDWKIWRRWEDAFYSGKADKRSAKSLRHTEKNLLFGGSSSVRNCRLICRPAKMLAENVDCFALAGLQEKAFRRPTIVLEPTLPLHNDGVARRVSEKIESRFHAQSELL